MSTCGSEITLAGVSAWYGQRRALSEVTLDITAGEFVAVVGPNGSGKSTLLSLLAGTPPRVTGSVLLGGTDLLRMPARDRAQRIGVLRQRQEIAAGFTVAELVDLGMPLTNRWFPSAPREVMAALDRTGCADLADRDAASLSGGQLQRVLVARAIVHQPSVVVLDEPTNHLDPRHRFELLDLVGSLGVTVVAALHDLDLARRYAARMVVLADGVLAANDSPRRALSPTVLSDVFGVSGIQIDNPETGRTHLLLDPLRPSIE